MRLKRVECTNNFNSNKQKSIVKNFQNQQYFGANVSNFDLPEFLANTKAANILKSNLEKLGDGRFEFSINTWTKDPNNFYPKEIENKEIGYKWSNIVLESPIGAEGKIIVHENATLTGIYKKAKEIFNIESEKLIKRAEL